MKSLRFQIIIPAHNEASVISKTLQSIVAQTLQPQQVIVVDDNSSDTTATQVKAIAKLHPFITLISHKSNSKHLPGSKVVSAFYKGFNAIIQEYDIICKFDADIILPTTYLETINRLFINNAKLGMASGILYIRKEDTWVYENIANKDHIRGPIKAYRKPCFEAIGGLKMSIGWDTVDVLLAKYNNWTTQTDKNLIVKHLKPTGVSYSKAGFKIQGEALYKMRYGLLITVITSIKMAILRRNASVFMEYLHGFFYAKRKSFTYLVSKNEGKFIRQYRWKGIINKLF